MKQIVRPGPILVTGGAGFLGNRLLKQLRLAGRDLVVVDDGSGGTVDRLHRIDQDARVRVYRVDLANETRTADVCRAERPAIVVHLAARHFLPYCEEHPDETWRTNVGGTLALTKALANDPPEVLVLASTGDVYNASSVPHGERDPVGLVSVYGRSKVEAEQIVQHAVHEWGKRALILRLFNVYGAHDTVDHLIPTILKQAFAGNQLSLGDLTTIRDYVYIDDVASAIIELINQDVAGIMNLGSGIGTSGQELVAVVSDLLKRPLGIVTDLTRVRKSKRDTLVGDPGRVQEYLTWWPATRIEVGLALTIQAMQIGSPEK